MTPMQTLKNNLPSLSCKLDKFEEINLNKSKPKDIVVQNVTDDYYLQFPHEKENFSQYSKKGVNSDFIKIFKAKTKQTQYSIAFHFTYLNIEAPLVKCSVKEADNFYITPDMNLLEFKDKLNSLNEQLESNNVVENVENVQKIFFELLHKNKIKRP